MLTINTEGIRMRIIIKMPVVLLIALLGSCYAHVETKPPTIVEDKVVIFINQDSGVIKEVDDRVLSTQPWDDGIYSAVMEPGKRYVTAEFYMSNHLTSTTVWTEFKSNHVYKIKTVPVGYYSKYTDVTLLDVTNGNNEVILTKKVIGRRAP